MMKLQIGPLVLLTFACGGEAPLGYDPNTGEEIVYRCPHATDEEFEAFAQRDTGMLSKLHDALVPSAHAVVLARKHGFRISASGAATQPCYSISTAHQCLVPQHKTFKWFFDIKPGTTATPYGQSLLTGLTQAPGVLGGPSGAGTGFKWNYGANAAGAAVPMKIGYSTNPGQCCASGGIGSPRTVIARSGTAPAPVTDIFSGGSYSTDFNLPALEAAFSGCGSGVTAQKVGKLFATHELMHVAGWGHRASGIMKPGMSCSDAANDLTLVEAHKAAMAMFDPGDHHDVTLIDVPGIPD